MAAVERRELIELSERIFDLFKNRTDGANRDVDDIHWRNVHAFALQKKVAENEVVEAFRRLEKLDLIMPSPSQPDGYYRLTSSGQAKDVADLIAARLRDRYAEAEKRRKRQRFYGIAAAVAVVLWILFGVVAPALHLLQYQPYMIIPLALLAIFALIGAGMSSLRSNEERIFFRFFASYLSLKKGFFAEAEKLILRAADTLGYSREFRDSRWRIVSKDVRQTIGKLEYEIRRKMLPAVVRKDPRVVRKSIELADAFATPSLERLSTTVSSIVGDLPEDREHRPATRVERLKENMTVYRSMHIIIILGLAAVLDVAVFLVLSFAEGHTLSSYYPSMAAVYIPSILAVIGLRSQVTRKSA